MDTLKINQKKNTVSFNQSKNVKEIEQFSLIKGDKGDQGPPGISSLSLLQLQASATGQTVYVLPNIIQNTSASWIEYCGVIYRAVSGDYTIANDVLTLSNPVIAPAMGDQFILVS